MPALPDVNKVVRCALVATLGSDFDVVTRFFIRYAGTAPTNSDLDEFAADISEAYNADLKGDIDADTVLKEIECVDLSSPSAAVGLWTGSITGTHSGTPLPANVCMVVSYQIARRYRGGHPRGYWRFGTISDEDTVQTWGATLLADVLSELGIFFAAVVAAGWTAAGTMDHVNVSYYSGFTVEISPSTGRARNVPTLRGTPVVDPVTALLPRAPFGSQRRRTRP